ncbi:hypothetical protein C0J52_14563 [Blattella germanica]|nr:hypothetical protein C0J52_14563 [Blattella germanica]
MYFVLNWGPNFMKHRPPFNLGSIIKTYNLLQIAACVYLVITLLKYGWKRYTFQCESLSFSENPETMQHVKGVYFYYLLKIIDLLDTVFIVLRKKENQVTFLHVYHHAVMIMIGWLWIRYFSGIHTNYYKKESLGKLKL